MKILYGLLTVLSLAGCTSVAELGGGRYAVPMTAEVRSPFGSNVAYGRLDDCEGYRDTPGATLQYRDCRPIHEWSDALVTQGVGGQIVGGALTGIGAGVGGAMVDTGSTVIQNVVVPAARGHH